MGKLWRVLVVAVLLAMLALPATAAARHRPAPTCKRIAGKNPAAASHGVYVFQIKSGNYRVCSGRGRVRTLPTRTAG
jgi:hypothetical protein